MPKLYAGGGGLAQVLLNCFRLARWLGDVQETHRTCGTHLELVLELTAHLRGPRGRRCRAVRQVRAASTSARCTQCAHHRGQRSRWLARSARCAQWPVRQVTRRARLRGPRGRRCRAVRQVRAPSRGGGAPRDGPLCHLGEMRKTGKTDVKLVGNSRKTGKTGRERLKCTKN